MVLIANYLINWMPSSVLNNKVPYFLLFLEGPIYTVPFSCFGSTYFVHELCRSLYKLSAHLLSVSSLAILRLRNGIDVILLLSIV